MFIKRKFIAFVETADCNIEAIILSHEYLWFQPKCCSAVQWTKAMNLNPNIFWESVCTLFAQTRNKESHENVLLKRKRERMTINENLCPAKKLHK